MRLDDSLLADVASASAAMLFNYLSYWKELSDAEFFLRIQNHIENAIIAWEECKGGWRYPIQPSAN